MKFIRALGSITVIFASTERRSESNQIISFWPTNQKVHKVILFSRPWARAIAMSHDAYSCKEFSHTSPFPTQRTEGLGNFVGSVVDTNSSLPFQAEFVCPKKCRPKNHQDWIYC